MEAVNLQAKKMGAKDSASSTEESLGVYRCGQEGRLTRIKVAQLTKVYARSVRKWIIMQVYARRNPAMIPSNRNQVK